MADNAGTVMAMYEAFGRGDVPFILDQMADDVEWERGGTDVGVPWLAPGRGKDHVAGFFERLAEHLEFKRFEPVGVTVGDGLVIALIGAEILVKSTGAVIEEDPEVHVWWFDEDGKATAFKHALDTARHIAAFRA